MQIEKGRILGELRAGGTESPEEAMERLQRYGELLEEKRGWAKLTSARLREDITEWILDSLTVLRALPCEELEVLDIGSGGGLLGVVLAVARPAWKVTMVESSARKSAFLAETAGTIGLERAEILRGRVEDLAGEREFDACVSRAAGRLGDMIGKALPLVRAGGKYVAVKQEDVEAEANNARGRIEEAGGTLEILRPEIIGRPGMSLVIVSKL